MGMHVFFHENIYCKNDGVTVRRAGARVRVGWEIFVRATRHDLEQHQSASGLSGPWSASGPLGPRRAAPPGRRNTPGRAGACRHTERQLSKAAAASTQVRSGGDGTAPCESSTRTECGCGNRRPKQTSALASCCSTTAVQVPMRRGIGAQMAARAPLRKNRAPLRKNRARMK